MKITSFRKKYSILASLFAVVFFTSIFSLQFLVQKIQEKNENIYKKLAEVTWQEDRLQSLSVMREHQEKMQVFQGIFDKNVLQEGEEISFIAFLEQTAKESGVEIVISTHQEVVTSKTKKEKEKENEEMLVYSKNVTPFDLEIKILGIYQKNMQFLYLLENAPTAIHIQSMDISQEKNEKGISSPSSGSGILQQKNLSKEESLEKEPSETEEERFSMNLLARVYIQKEIVEEMIEKKEDQEQK